MRGRVAKAAVQSALTFKLKELSSSLVRPIFEGGWAGLREREGSIFSNHQHFAVSTGISGVACPLPASRVDNPWPYRLLQACSR